MLFWKITDPQSSLPLFGYDRLVFPEFAFHHSHEMLQGVGLGHYCRPF